jgi:predicted chitinase
VLQYKNPTNQMEPSTIYKFADFRKAVTEMYTDGIGDLKLYIGDGADEEQAVKYGLVNIAAFIAQSMKETIQYDACTENSWDRGGWSNGRDPATNACGQLGQDYNSYTCPSGQEFMECDVEAMRGVSIKGTTHAQWYGAPAAMECFPTPDKKAGYWDNAYECNSPWKDPPETCDEYPGQKAGAWIRDVEAPNFGGQADLSGCAYWGRGVIQTTGKCNFGKLNYYLGAGGTHSKVPLESRRVNNSFAGIDFCANPEAICNDPAATELKWIAGFFYWAESVQEYKEGEYDYIKELKKFVDEGMQNPGADAGFIRSVSGIVNRGCWNPPCPPNGELDGGADRAKNFQLVLQSFGLIPKRSRVPHDQFTHMQHGTPVAKKDAKKFDFVAKLLYKDPKADSNSTVTDAKGVADQYCAGALIRNDTVLTAASCCDFRAKSGINVQVAGVTSAVEKMVWVDRYGFNPRSEKYNLCKLTLAKAVPAEAATPVALDTKSAAVPFKDGTPLVLAGFGDSDGVVRTLNVPAVSPTTCNAPGAYNNRVSPVEMCIGSSEDEAVAKYSQKCQGDMGGPLVEDKDGKMILVGIASSGNGCRTPKSYALMTKVSTLVGWIHADMPGHYNSMEGDISAKFGSTDETGRK